MKKVLYPLGIALPLLFSQSTEAAFIIDQFNDTQSVSGSNAQNVSGRDMFGTVNVGSGFATLTSGGLAWDGIDPAPPFTGPTPANNQSWDLSTYTQFQIDVSNISIQTFYLHIATKDGAEEAFLPVDITSVTGVGNWATMTIPFADFALVNPDVDFSDIDSFMVLGDNDLSLDNIEANGGISPVPEAREYGLLSGAVCLGLLLFRRKTGGTVSSTAGV